MVSRDGDDGFTVAACYSDEEGTRRCALARMYSKDDEDRRNQPWTHQDSDNR